MTGRYKLMLHNGFITEARPEDLGRVKTYGTLAEAKQAQLERQVLRVTECREQLERELAALARLTPANQS